MYANDKTTYIYVLCEPDGETIRYVGKTVTPQKRYNAHLSEARQRRKDHRTKWVYSVLKRNERPVMRIIDEIPPGGDWAEAERHWIAHYRSVGCKLVNTTDGGEGNLGLRHTDEVKRKLSEERKGRHLSEEHRRHISEGLMGNPPTNKTEQEKIDEIQRLYLAGINRTEIGRRVGVCWITVQKYTEPLKKAS